MLIGSSPVWQKVVSSAARVATEPVSVLLQGETGTGKGVLAEYIHTMSGRTGAFIVINCAGLTATMAESELFGHTAGAFTGAVRDRWGAFQAAHNGTLFLDEVGDMPVEVQPMLLRALQSGRVRRLGSMSEESVNVRILSATNRPLWALSRLGHFRRDLLERLAGYEVYLPPLRERGRDVLALADHIIATHPTIQRLALTSTAQAELQRHAWPGNIRELERILVKLAVDGFAQVTGADIKECLIPHTGDEETHAVLLLAQKGPVKVDDVCNALRLHTRTAQRLLVRMAQSGALQRSGSGRNLIYKLSQPAPQGDESQQSWLQ